ncbi:MAG: heavy-metal-associated domain-containing protein [Actinomycetales bacterium]|nr:heavy-metal-associated domain-containing protein [Actinomycetales bacterium]
MSTQTFQVDGLTCGHCVGHVTTELTAVEGVQDVRVDLVAGGTSTVHVDLADDQALTDEQIVAALEEAGSYTLVR